MRVPDLTDGLLQQARLLRVDVPGHLGQFVVERMSGSEAVNALFRFDIDCLVPDVEIPVDTLIGEPVALHLLSSKGELRSWQGHCSATAALGSDGGPARYRLSIEPWLAFLGHTRNSRVFQDKDIRAICDELFATCHPHAAWRFDLTQAPRTRRLCVQHRETDLDFLLRLLAEEGLSYRFEHGRSPEGGGRGDELRHELVVFDRASSLPAGADERIRFHRADATEKDDTVQTLADLREVVPGRVARSSWNPSTLVATSGTAESSADAFPAEQHDGSGAGRYDDEAAASLDASLALSVHESRQRRLQGKGTVRSLEPGRQFALEGHWEFHGDDARFAVLRVEHQAANNLGSRLAALLQSPETEAGTYLNRFELQPAAVPFMPARRDKPLAWPETALVVGEAGALACSDRDHRIRVRFHWQDEPRAASATQAGTDGVEVRVAEWLGGADWGSNFLPRAGTEVLVEFVDGDIDQPLVVGQLYNGVDLPPFAAGHGSEANHPGAIWGWMSLGAGKDTGAFNQWVVDDSPGQLRTRLATSYAGSQLSLGHLIDHDPANASRSRWRGAGFELRSDAWLALRGGEGILVSSTPRDGGAGTQMEAPEAAARLRQAERVAEALSDAASAAGAGGLQANTRQAAFVESIGSADSGVAGTAPSTPRASRNAQGNAPAARGFRAPLLLSEGPDDVGLATEASILLHTGACAHVTAQEDFHVAAADTVSVTAGSEASWFSRGGIEAIAAAGGGSVRALSGRMEILADGSVTVTSSSDEVRIVAKDRLVLQAGRSSVTLAGENIVFACPGVFSVKGTGHAFEGPQRQVTSSEPPASGATP